MLLNDCLKSGQKPPQLSVPDDSIITENLENSFLQLAAELRTPNNDEEEAENSNSVKLKSAINTTPVKLIEQAGILPDRPSPLKRFAYQLDVLNKNQCAKKLKQDPECGKTDVRCSSILYRILKNLLYL